MSDQLLPQYATRRERRAAERAAEAAAAGSAPTPSEVDDDGVALGSGAALTREQYEARMAELADQAGEHAVGLAPSPHHDSGSHETGPHETAGAEHAGPEHVDPQVRAEQEALAARAAALNAAQRGTPAGPAVTDAPVSPDSGAPVAEPHEAHNLGAVTPLRYEHDPAFDFPTIAAPNTSMLFLTWDPATGRAQPLQGTRVGEPSDDAAQSAGGVPADAAAPDVQRPSADADGAPSTGPSSDTSPANSAASSSDDAGALTASSDDVGDAATAAPVTGWVPTADLLDDGAPQASSATSDSSATTPSSAGAPMDAAASSAAPSDAIVPPAPVGAADSAGLDPLDSRTARQGRRPWVAALIGTAAIVVIGLAVLAVTLFVR